MCILLISDAQCENFIIIIILLLLLFYYYDKYHEKIPFQ